MSNIKTNFTQILLYLKHVIQLTYKLNFLSLCMHIPRFCRRMIDLRISPGLVWVSHKMSIIAVRHSVGCRFFGLKNFKDVPEDLDVMPIKTCMKITKSFKLNLQTH